MSALYIHIPFCKTRCNYCDFYKQTQLIDPSLYFNALEREMEFRRDFFAPGEPLRTVYFGGGTPSVYPPSFLQSVLDKAATLWPLDAVTEITAEANPDDVNDATIRALKATGINRISFGIQSFIDRDLRFMGRRHTAAQAVDAVRRVQDAGIGNVSIDLIFGIPGMTLREWEQNVLRALLLNVQHISVYCLTIAEGTVFGRMAAEGRLTPATDEACAEQYLLCHRILTDGGFEHYEISNYALHNRRSRHNSAYWDGTPYLGLGPSAHSYDGQRRIFAASDLKGYLAGAGTGTIYSVETLSPRDRYNEYIMTGLRTSDGIRREVLTSRFGAQALIYFEYMAGKLLQSGALVREGDTYRIPPERFMVSNDIISELFYVDE